MTLADRLADAATALLDVLDLPAVAALPFDAGGRRDWVYWPAARPGVPLHALDRRATKAVHRTLAVALPEPAFAQVVAIMGLDEVLDRQEGYAGDRRHRDDYWVAVYGTPGADPWALRFEGHHVSLHVTVSGGSVRMTPLFLGANPAVVHDGSGRTVSAPLAPEEDLGFELLHALTPGERAGAVLAETAPRDIVTRNAPAIDASLAETGVPLAGLGPPAAAAARALVACYLDRFPDGAGRPTPDGARFAWAGADEPGHGHYYRIAGPRLLVELDNTQNGANHVHTVVRDPGSDFGDDILAAHHRTHHAP